MSETETWTFKQGKWTVKVHKIARSEGSVHPFKWRATLDKKLRGESSAGFAIQADNPAELICKLIDRTNMKWPP